MNPWDVYLINNKRRKWKILVDYVVHSTANFLALCLCLPISHSLNDTIKLFTNKFLISFLTHYILITITIIMEKVSFWWNLICLISCVCVCIHTNYVERFKFIFNLLFFFCLYPHLFCSCDSCKSHHDHHNYYCCDTFIKFCFWGFLLNFFMVLFIRKLNNFFNFKNF